MDYKSGKRYVEVGKAVVIETAMRKSCEEFLKDASCVGVVHVVGEQGVIRCSGGNTTEEKGPQKCTKPRGVLLNMSLKLITNRSLSCFQRTRESTPMRHHMFSGGS